MISFHSFEVVTALFTGRILLVAPPNDRSRGNPL